MTTRRQRGSVRPLSFYGIKFRLPALASAPAKPISEKASQDRVTRDEAASAAPLTRDLPAGRAGVAGRGALPPQPESAPQQSRRIP